MNETPASASPATKSRPVTIEYFTDPLCSWSWACEPQWRRLRYQFADYLDVRNRMGGMIPNWTAYSDPLNSVSRPAQMGPHWFHVRETSGAPIDERLWHEDPPESSYPACIAFYAARMQGESHGEQYLRLMREAVMLRRQNIARPEVLLRLADELAGQQLHDEAPERFDPQRFKRDLSGEPAAELFREDLKESRYRQIERFPAWCMRGPAGPAMLMIGFRPYDVLAAAVAQALDGHLPEPREAHDLIEYIRYWGRVTAHDVAQAFAMHVEDAQAALEAAIIDGAVERHLLVDERPAFAVYTAPRPRD